MSRGRGQGIFLAPQAGGLMAKSLFGMGEADGRADRERARAHRLRREAGREGRFATLEAPLAESAVSPVRAPARGALRRARPPGRCAAARRWPPRTRWRRATRSAAPARS